MSKDIRSFFAPIKKSAASSEGAAKTEKKRVFNIADSDEEDDFVHKPQVKKGKFEKPKVKTPSPKKKEPEKPVDISTFFGKSLIQQKPQTLIKQSDGSSVKNSDRSHERDGKRRSKKTKEKASSSLTVDHFDDDFEATLCEIDEEILGVTPRKEKVETPAKSVGAGDNNEKNMKLENEFPIEAKRTLNITLNDAQKTPKNDASDRPPCESDSKRKANAEAYQRFLNRGGPRNPGSKPIPKGTPNCLQGKSFVITGVLESLDREEAADLISKCGGRATSSVSKRTSYIIIGEEPGESKLKKAEQFRIPHLSEDGLLELIRNFEPSDSEVESKYFSGGKRKDNEATNTSVKKIKREEKDYNTNKAEVTTEVPRLNTITIKDNESSSSGIDCSFNSSSPVSQKGSTSGRVKMVIDAKDFSTKNLSRTGSIISQPSSSGIGSSIESSALKQAYGQPAISLSNLPIERSLGDSLWVDKYKPKSTKAIIGQAGEKSNVKKLIKWLTDWYKHHGSSEKKKTARPAPWAHNSDDGSYYKAALLSGPPGVGKTTTVTLVCQELEYDTVEFNASDTRSKRLLSDHVAELLGSKSIRNYFSVEDKQTTKRHVLVMDEVDGMAGNEDRGGIQELIQLIKNTRVPIVCMCNDRSHPKMRSLVNYCFDLRFNRPRVEQIKGAMLSICCKEGLKIPGDALNDMITSANQDVRQVLHNLSLWTVKDKELTTDQVKESSAKAKKSLKMGPWDVARQVFSASEQEKTTLREKEDLFFQDYSLGPLFVQDTYARVKPYKAKGEKRKTLECLSRAADSLAWGDVVERNIRSQNAWSLLPVQALFSSVIPGYEMAGHVMGQINFPAWLGKNSKRGRMDRLLQELHVHTRLRTSGNKTAMNLDYSYLLRDTILRPLIQEGSAGVPKSLKVMEIYQLLREDLDSLVELCQWPNGKEPFGSIDSKVKAAFTRAYNKESPATPYAATVSVKKSKVDETELLEDAIGEGDEWGNDEDEEPKDDIASDAMIKKGKASTKKSGGKKDESRESKGKGSKKGGKAGKK